MFRIERMLMPGLSRLYKAHGKPRVCCGTLGAGTVTTAAGSAATRVFCMTLRVGDADGPAAALHGSRGVLGS